jgi:hypothetical protein
MYKIPYAKKVVLFDKFRDYDAITSDGNEKSELRKLKWSIGYPIKEGDTITYESKDYDVIYTEPKGEVKISRNTQIEMYGVNSQSCRKAIGLGLIKMSDPYEEFKKEGLVNKKGLKI